MAYTSSRLFAVQSSAAKVTSWLYITTDTFATVSASNYFSDALLRRVKPGDPISVVIFTTTLPDGELSGFSSFNSAVFSSVSSSGGTVAVTSTVLTAAQIALLTGLGAGVTHDANYTLVAADAGSALYHGSASAHSWTIPSATLPVGSVVTFTTGQSSGTLSILAGGGVTLERVDGTAGTGTRTMAAASKVTAYQRSADVWELSGVFAS